MTATTPKVRAGRGTPVASLVRAVAFGAATLALWALVYGTQGGLRFDVDAAHGLDTRGYDIDFFLFSIRIVAPLTLVAIVVIAIRKQIARSLAAATVLAGGVGSSLVLKELLGRLDPLHGDAARGIGDFFPSVHTATATSAGCALLILAGARVRTPLAFLVAAYATAVGMASVVAGGHYPSDVLGALLLTAAWASAGVGVLHLLCRETAERAVPDRPLALAAASLLAPVAILAVAFVTESGWARDHLSSVAGLSAIGLLAPLIVTLVLVDLGPGAGAGSKAGSVALVTVYAILAALIAAFVFGRVADEARTIPVADGFEYPIGNPATGQPFTLVNGFCSSGGSRGYQLGENLGVRDVPVRAAASGRIVVAGFHRGWDGAVLIEHRLLDGRTVFTMYGHLQKITVSGGADVRRGQPIGTSGPPDRRTDVVKHLHFEVKTLGTIGSGWSPHTPCPPYGYLDPDAFVRGVLAAR